MSLLLDKTQTDRRAEQQNAEKNLGIEESLRNLEGFPPVG